MAFLTRISSILTHRCLHTSRLLLNIESSTTPVELRAVNKLKGVAGSQTTLHVSKDPSLIKLATWIVIFGSILTHVIDKKRQYEEMEGKYILKINILKNIIKRLNNGETVDIEDELRLINQTLERKNIPRYESLLQSRKRQKSKFLDGTITENSNCSSNGDTNQESLEDIWSNVLKDISTLPTSTLSTTISTNKTHKNDSSFSDDIIRDRNILLETSKQEQKESKYFIPTNTHVIVNKPGELMEASKDTQMKKYF